MKHQTICLPRKKRGFHLITDEILNHIDLPKNQCGLLYLHLLHTSAAITINENADSTVRDDFETFINQMVPENFQGFTHTFEGADDMPAHIKSSLFGVQLHIPFEQGKLLLGTWQGIYLCEFRDHATARKIIATII